MNRYKKANEGIHVPDEVKEKAVRPSGRRPHSRWMGAVAAMLAVAIIGGIAAWSGRTGVPAMSNEDPGRPSSYGSSIGTGAGAAPVSRTLAAAQYPKMAAFPIQEDYVSPITGKYNYENYRKDHDAWRGSWDALRSGTDYTGMLDGFLTASTAQFLTDAGTENRVYSPLNVYMALSMLAETAGGNSRQQILDLLQVDSIEALRARASALWKDNYRDDGVVTSILANSLWLRDDFTYSQTVLNTLAEDYYASSFSGQMGTEEYNQALREWINEQTKGLLAGQAGELELQPETALALVSAIYFKAAWNSEFNKARTERDVFHAPSGDVETDFMRKGTQGRYYWGDHFAAVSLSFQEGGEMWLILPDEGCSVDQLLDSGEAMKFLMADKNGTYNEEGEFVSSGWPNQKRLIINLSMPRFDVSSDLSLIDGLKRLGVTDVFDCRVSNFDPLEASTTDPLYVSRAQHAARVKVDEQGCEAAAYTIIDILYGSAAPPNDEIDFILDRPFLFAIMGDSGLPLFTGVVNQPNH